MAQGALATGSYSLNGTGSSVSTALTAEELRELLEYDRIVQFRDAVLAGTHPRIKVPPHLVGKPVPPPINFLPVNSQVSNIQGHSVLPPKSTPPAAQSSESQDSQKDIRAAGPYISNAKTEINPILLEKSDDLIRAEIQLQRQRLERDLREQIEQQRVAARAALQTSEALPGFDLSEVLSKALAIAQSSIKTDVKASGDGRSSASDSFDERTFYSSQHDTPMSSSSQGHQESVESRSHNVVSPNSQKVHMQSVLSNQAVIEDGQNDAAMFNTSFEANGNAAESTVNGGQDLHLINTSSSSNPSTQAYGVPTASKSANVSGIHPQTRQNIDNALVTPSAPTRAQSAVQRTNNQVREQTSDNSRPSPLIRAHNLSPYAPQPSRVSPLITTRDVPALLEPQPEGAQPAQVAALRHVASGLSSTDSSPRASKIAKKKKKEKNKSKGKDREKKRKAKDNVPASPDSPYIKPEPQSPEPFTTASLPRPQKRPRRSGQFAAGLTYEEPEILDSRPREFESQSIIRAYSRNENRYENERPAHGRSYHGPETSYRVRERGRLTDAASPVYVAMPAPQSRPSRVVSRAVDEPQYYREQGSRASVRPETYRERSRSPIYSDHRPVFMAPSRRPMRIVVDEYGNEYLEPIPSVVAPTSFRREQISRASVRPEHERQQSGSPILQDNTTISMAPPKRAMRVVLDEFGNEYLEPISNTIQQPRYQDSNLSYHRAQSRAVSSRIPTNVIEDGGRIYRQASPLPARRVITQPEIVSRETGHRVYGQREYSALPQAENHQFVELRAPERRTVSYHEEPVREVIRQSTVRPEAVRYELPRDYPHRVQSIRPEEPPIRVYTSSVRPEARRELPPQPIREYSVRPDGPSRVYAPSIRQEAGREVVSQRQREYSVRPAETMQRRLYSPIQGEQFYGEEPARRAGEVTYIERPGGREGSVVVYADDVRDVRREVYR